MSRITSEQVDKRNLLSDKKVTQTLHSSYVFLGVNQCGQDEVVFLVADRRIKCVYRKMYINNNAYPEIFLHFLNF